MKKIVYLDGNYTKVVKGECKDDGFFIIVTDQNNNTITLNKRFVISIQDGDFR